MRLPEFSVVIPTRNRPESLIRCLDALAAQELSLGTFEVIVVDDGSDPPITLNPSRWDMSFHLRLVRQVNSGPGGARNRGVEEAFGEYLAFTDDDCVPARSWLLELKVGLEEYPGSLIGGSTYNGLRNHFFSEVSQLILWLVYEHFNRDITNSCFFTSNNMGCRREDFLAVGGFDSSYRVASEDRDLCSRWRSSNRTLVWRREAWIEHMHAQNLVGFVKLHFRYGIGAWKYQHSSAVERPGPIIDESHFHFALPKLIARQLRGKSFTRRVAILAALAVWQVAYAAGYLYAVIENLIFGGAFEERAIP